MDPADPRLAAIIRRVLVENGLTLDPFTLLELATMMQPLLRDPEKPYASESARNTVLPVFRKMGVENPEETAEKLVAEIARRCRVLCS